MDKILQDLEKMGCFCHEPRVLLKSGDRVVIKCGNCRIALAKETYEILLGHREQRDAEGDWGIDDKDCGEP